MAIDPGFPAFFKSSMELAASQDLSEAQAGTTLKLSIVFFVLAVAFVALRFLSRFARQASYGLDDWLILAALFVLTGSFAGLSLMVKHGLGKHRGALAQADAEHLSQFLFAAEILYVFDITLIKLSILSMYYRVFPVRSMKVSGWALGGATILLTIALFVIAGFQCVPLEKLWKPWVAGRCLDLQKSILGIAVPYVISDIAILGLPLPQIWKLPATYRQKLLLSSMFLLGSLVVAISIYQFITFIRLDVRDLSFTASPGCEWSMIELSSGIISACLPTMFPLVRQVVAKMRGDQSCDQIEDTTLEDEKVLRLQTLMHKNESSRQLTTVDSHELDGQRKFQTSHTRSNRKEPEGVEVEEQKMRVMRLIK